MMSYLEFDQLTKAQQAALHVYMAENSEFDSLAESAQHCRDFIYRVETPPRPMVAHYWHHFGYDWKTKNFRARRPVKRIIEARQKTGQVWPYITEYCWLTREWMDAADEHHGDGRLRVAVSLRYNEPVEFLFWERKPKLNVSRFHIDDAADGNVQARVREAPGSKSFDRPARIQDLDKANRKFKAGNCDHKVFSDSCFGDFIYHNCLFCNKSLGVTYRPPDDDVRVGWDAQTFAEWADNHLL
jgi:hypothetical protein